MEKDERTEEIQIPESLLGSTSNVTSSSPQLLVMTGPDAGRNATVRSRVTIGRDAKCTLFLSAGDVSREHAVIEKTKHGFQIRDTNSRNGICVNGEHVHQAILEVGDRVMLGGETLLLFSRHDRFEERLLHRQRMESVGRLAAGVAHDFNNLLSAIKTNIELIDIVDAEERIRVMDDLHLAVQHATDLTGQILGLSRRGVASGSIISVSSLVAEALHLSEHAFQPQIQIDLRAGPGLEVVGNGSELRQVFINLFTNAADAMHEGGSLTITSESAERHVVIRVTDTGCGMSEATRSRIFEPFFTTKSPGRGTGLGLATSASIINAHGGTISAASLPNSGSVFTVSLPAARHRITLPGPQTTDTSDLPATVLLVDDDERFVRSVSRFLKHGNYNVIQALDGHEAVRLFRDLHDQINVVILDIIMPEMDGRACFQELQKIKPGVRVIVVSGIPPQKLEQWLHHAGIRDFLGKPFDFKKLESAIRTAIHQSHLH